MAELFYRGPTKPVLYHADPGPDLGVGPTLSSSLAHTIVTKSPLHAYARHPRLGGDAEDVRTKPKDTGTILHALILDAGMDDVWTVEADNFKTQRAKAARDEAIESGATPILLRELDELREAARRIAERLESGFGIQLHKGRREEAIVWKDEIEATAVLEARPFFARALLDCVQGAEIYDLKSARDAEPTAAAKSVANYGYPIQQAAYTRALEVAEPALAGRVGFTFVFVEPTPPYACGVYGLDGGFRDWGQRKWDLAAALWERGLRTGNWPGYGAGLLEAPAWFTRSTH